MKFVKQHVSKAVLAIVMLGGFVLPAAAQDLKIGVVSLPALIERAPQTKAAMDALQEEFAPRQREFEAKKKEYDDLAAKIQKDLAVMGETERRNAQKEVRDLERDLARMHVDRSPVPEWEGEDLASIFARLERRAQPQVVLARIMRQCNDRGTRLVSHSLYRLIGHLATSADAGRQGCGFECLARIADNYPVIEFTRHARQMACQLTVTDEQ